VGPWALTTSNSTLTTVNYTALSTKSDPVKLQVIANPTSYSLGYIEGEGTSFTTLATFDSEAVSVAPSGFFFFKGVQFGLYNTGNGKPSLSPADFAYWKQTVTG